MNVTENGRIFMREKPMSRFTFSLLFLPPCFFLLPLLPSRLPNDYSKYPGKMDHTTLLCFEIGDNVEEVKRVVEKEEKEREEKEREEREKEEREKGEEKGEEVE